MSPRASSRGEDRSRSRVTGCVVTVLAAVVGAGCGGSSSGCAPGASCVGSGGGTASGGGTGSRGSLSPVPSAPAALSPVAAAAPPVVVWDAQDGSVSYFLDLEGHELGQVTRPPVPAGSTAVATGESNTRYFEINGSLLAFFGSHGSPRGNAPFTPGQSFLGPVFSPDDSSWVWTTQSIGGGAAQATRVYVGSTATPVRQVTEHADPAAHQLAPVAFARGLVYLSEQATDSGDQLAFPSLSGAWTLDLSSGALRQVGGGDCNLQDVAADGTLLCLDAPRHLLTVRGARGSTTLHYAGSWDQAGSATFSTDASRVVVATASAAGQRRGAYVGPSGGGEMTALAGTYATFLPDGRLLVLHEQGGFDLVSAGGARTSVEVPNREQTGAFAGLIPSPRD